MYGYVVLSRPTNVRVLFYAKNCCVKIKHHFTVEKFKKHLHNLYIVCGAALEYDKRNCRIFQNYIFPVKFL